MKLIRRLFGMALIALVLVGGGFVASSYLNSNRTVRDLMTENRNLKDAVANLTAESQIGYAKVISQTERDGKLFTRLKFVETARDDQTRHVLEREYEIEGDTVHFDAVIVKFTDEYVMDGRERALYLWRRIYGENMAPADGFPIEELGAEPRRYEDIFSKLPLEERSAFWTEIWKLADDPNCLASKGIKAIYGNAVYKKVRPGIIYVFKISSTGQVYPESVPAL